MKLVPDSTGEKHHLVPDPQIEERVFFGAVRRFVIDAAQGSIDLRPEHAEPLVNYLGYASLELGKGATQAVDEDGIEAFRMVLDAAAGDEQYPRYANVAASMIGQLTGEQDDEAVIDAELETLDADLERLLGPIHQDIQ